MSTLFGKPTNIVGEVSKELILRGASLKYQFGNKFIELIKEGKINVEKENILKEIDSIDSIVKDGIYLIENKIVICINNNKITLEKVVTSFISYLEEQPDLTAEQKQTALLNSGFYYKTLDEAKSAELKSGIVFILEENTFYVVKDKDLIKFTLPLEENNSFSTLNTEVLNTKVLGLNNKEYISFESDRVSFKKEIELGETTIKNDELKTKTLICNNFETTNIFSAFSTQDNIIISVQRNELENVFDCYFKYPNTFRINDIIYIETTPLIINQTLEDEKVTFTASDYVHEPIEIIYYFGESDTEATITINKHEISVKTDKSEINNWDIKKGDAYKNISLVKNRIITGKITAINNDKISIDILTTDNLINKKIVGSGNATLPPNTIIIYYGEIIPYGWAKCDGTKGTPDIPSLTTNVNYIMKL